MEEIFSLISTYGFPMVLCVYLLIRLEPLIRELKNSIDTLIILNNLDQDQLQQLKNKN